MVLDVTKYTSRHFIKPPLSLWQLFLLFSLYSENMCYAWGKLMFTTFGSFHVTTGVKVMFQVTPAPPQDSYNESFTSSFSNYLEWFSESRSQWQQWSPQHVFTFHLTDRDRLPTAGHSCCLLTDSLLPLAETQSVLDSDWSTVQIMFWSGRDPGLITLFLT